MYILLKGFMHGSLNELSGHCMCVMISVSPPYFKCHLHVNNLVVTCSNTYLKMYIANDGQPEVATTGCFTHSALQKT